MLKSKACITVMIGALALVCGSANAHGWLSKPSVAFPNDVDPTQFVATIDASTSGLSGSFGQSPANNAAAFWTAFKASKYTSIKEFATELGQIVVNGANIECGLTDLNENPQPLPNELEWIHTDTEGFTKTHEGPCEAWCGETRVFQDSNCAAHFTTAPAKMSYDKANCIGASRLTFYWLALHTPTWQVYVNCAVLEGSRGSHSPSQSNSTSNVSTKQQPNTSTNSAAVPTMTTSLPTATTTTSFPTATTMATSTVASITPTFTAAPTAVAGSGHGIAGSNQYGEDGELFDVAGGENNEVVGDASIVGEECGSFDIASGEVDRGSLDGSEVDESYGSSDSVGTTADESTTMLESSLNFVSVDNSYSSGKVKGSYQN
ncbi:unnamed protein product [Peronospora destructor]|uniref:Uncharacterized protein n=1 Tax=Peronospora destructor TaxID=86335 RepID=A0AAV0SWL7_9STRA|nr:unnamed protein product [Peronospora destructor]